MVNVQAVSFNIKVTGETTGEEFTGSFKVKPVLTQAEQLGRDAVMRDLLGGRSSDASPRAVSQALILAEIQIRCVDAPMWWKESKNGLTLFDEVVMSTVYDKIMDIEKEWRADVKKKADEAREALNKVDPSRG